VKCGRIAVWPLQPSFDPWWNRAGLRSPTHSININCRERTAQNSIIYTCTPYPPRADSVGVHSRGLTVLGSLPAHPLSTSSVLPFINRFMHPSTLYSPRISQRYLLPLLSHHPSMQDIAGWPYKTGSGWLGIWHRNFQA
jgi:hypothetical protein